MLENVRAGDVLRWKGQPWHEWTKEPVVKLTKMYVVTEGRDYKDDIVYHYWRKKDGYMRGIRISSSFPNPRAEPMETNNEA